jgi:short subunit dehydrogenase-like uncharacterized protein
MRAGRGPLAPLAAAATSAGLAGVAAVIRSRQARPLLDRVLPAPGSGPGEDARRRGHFTFQLRAVTAGGARWSAVVAARSDPGYAATSVMLGESGLCLAADRDRLPERAGVLTPATALGGVLAQRLRDNGFRLDVRPLPAA